MTGETGLDETGTSRSEQEPSANRISRRKVLTQVGAGLAIAWAAPIIKSVPAYASVMGSPPPLCPQCGPFNFCNETPVCGQDQFSHEDCICVERVEDPNCTCYDNGGFCQRNTNICATDARCVALFGPGYQCLQLRPSTVACVSFCGTATTMCGAPCSSGLDETQKKKNRIRKTSEPLGPMVVPDGLKPLR